MTTRPLTTLVLQNAGSKDQLGLLEAILEACEDATYGAGAFAWATANGLRLVIDDDAFAKFLEQGSFDLIVGVDAITDLRCLDAADEILRRRPNLTISVLLHERNSLFHPKVCWFRNASGGVLIAGSGNLTVGGLRANWEAFTITPLTRHQADALEHQWNEWRGSHAELLLTPGDSRARDRASRNIPWEGSGKRRAAMPPVPVLEEQEALAAETAGDVSLESASDARVLVAEIPRGDDRWRQANFDLKNYEGFFRASVGAKRRILLQYVSADGALEVVETRQSVEVKSRNFRIELGHAPRLDYPEVGRPIGVFIRLPTEVFWYHVLMPGDSGYDEVEELLQRTWTGPEGRVRRVEFSVAELREAWLEAPFWKVATSSGEAP